jgi:hypothetical protein
MDWSRIALVAQTGPATCFQAVQWLPLGQLNYQPGFPPLGAQAVQGMLQWAGVAFVGACLLPLTIYALADVKRLTWLK